MKWLALLPWIALTAHTIANAFLLRRLPRGATTTERIAVLLPVRDEAARITPCLESLLAQRGVENLTIHVLDDGSTDGTSEVVRAIAGDKIELLTGTSLPPGWLGKPHACRQLADAVPGATVLSFVDADVTLHPDALANAVTEMRRIRAGLLSPYPKITGAGRLVQPLLQWSWLTFLPLRAMERSPRPSLAAAGGQWLVIDAEAYRKAGGHAAVRTEILEDIALARAVKRSGGRIALADGSAMATCRMYDSWPELTAGYAKSLWASFGSSSAAGVVVLLLLFLYATPPATAAICAAAGEFGWAGLALTAYGLGVLGRIVSALATGGRAWPDALAHPVSVGLFAWLVARSFRLRRRGALTWRGRPV
ncbi:glycosyltransferase family 2 protein [Actinoplanes bogorensis]|uniref:Glycosyltransferase family 2 protein n=1 Tax=Paractinoplanes bogorensis TaxID=1610840 RepID=A0ABS5YQC5_9ACTN|nr:glycosyltransferase family A protein [Actinoplanes bogorensis]MBU2665647.1 glycosyltransferase family 2 protein [Actinoplanes bogorensis]